MAAGDLSPDDPEHTTERVERAGVLRVGVTEHAPLIVRRPGRAPSGREVELLERFAQSRGLRIDWVWGQQEALFHGLERHELQLVAGGVHAHTPWAERLALTRPWREQPDPLVLALPPGENRWLYEVEQFLASERGGAP